MVQALGNRIDFKIVTKDRDLHDKTSYENVETRKWLDVGNCKVMYLQPQNWSAVGIQQSLTSTSYDLLYINSVFSPIGGICPLLLSRTRLLRPTPIVLAPRGEFSPGALANKRLKKQVFLCLAKLLGLHRQVVWHATSELEKKDIIRTLGVRPDNVLTAPNLVSLGTAATSFTAEAEITPNVLRLVFLSRIVPKKNLSFLLTALQLVESPIRLSIFGPTEDEVYWESCLAMISRLPRNITVEYGGDVRPQDITSVLQKHDLFVFPTLGENFGHVIFEALSAGLPILLSDTTPWTSDGTDAVNVQPLHIKHWVQQLEIWARKSVDARILAKQTAIEYARNFCSANPAVSQTFELFETVIKRTRRS